MQAAKKLRTSVTVSTATRKARKFPPQCRVRSRVNDGRANVRALTKEREGAGQLTARVRVSLTSARCEASFVHFPRVLLAAEGHQSVSRVQVGGDVVTMAIEECSKSLPRRSEIASVLVFEGQRVLREGIVGPLGDEPAEHLDA